MRNISMRSLFAHYDYGCVTSKKGYLLRKDVVLFDQTNVVHRLNIRLLGARVLYSRRKGRRLCQNGLANWRTEAFLNAKSLVVAFFSSDFTVELLFR